MILYKYAGDSGIKILQDLRLKITPPNEFNDPFELTPQSRFTMTVGYLLDQLKNDPEWFRQPYELMVKHRGYPHAFERFLADLPVEIPRRFNEFRGLWRLEQSRADLGSLADASHYMGILCVSRPNDSIPMWSYYANNHRGIALGLDLCHPCFEHGFRGAFGPVKYRKSRCSVDPRMPDGPELLKEFVTVIFTKSIVWRHEKEYRRVYRLDELLRPLPGPDRKQYYFLNISGESIQEIILGCWVDLAYEQEIRDELSRRPRTFGHIKLSRCERHRSRFELKIVPA
jgi:hypothetical protein